MKEGSVKKKTIKLQINTSHFEIMKDKMREEIK